MSVQINDIGIIQAILECFEKHHLPRVVEIKEKLDRGDILNEFDIEYMSEAIHDNCGLMPYLGRHPDYESLVSKVIHYYKSITDEALANER